MKKKDVSDKDMGEGKEVDEEEREDEDEAEKSLTADDLEKSLAALEAHAGEGNGDSRKTELLAKASAGSLDESERDELFKALGGTEEPSDSLAKSATEGLRGNSEIEHAIDVSPYLAEQHSELCKSIETLSGAIESNGQRDSEFNLLLSKAMVDIGGLLKSQTAAIESIQGRLGIIAQQPARAPKSVTGAKVLEKGFGGMEPGDEPLSKGMVLGAMSEMLQKSMDAGSSDIVAGESLMNAVAKFESADQISKSMLAAVRQHLNERAA